MIKLTRKELKSPDQIWQTSRSLLTWMTDRMAALLILVGFVFAGIIVGVYVYQSQQKTEGRAQYHYSLAKTYMEQLKVDSTDEKAPKDRATSEANLKTELDILNAEFKGSFANRLADQIRADLSVRANNWAEAAQHLETYAKALPATDKDFALYPLAQAYEQAKDFPKALTAYESILARKNSVYSPLALLGKARAFKNLNKPAEAKQSYEIFIEKYPDSPEVATVRGLLALSQEETSKK